MEKVEDQSLIVPQVEEGLYALSFEGFIMLVLVSTHGINHLLADSDGRLPHGLGRRVLAEDETKVDVEEVT